ncbi:MAG TPA: trigger factor [Mycobacteriales bacterium]|nr:trigger factor [Mycobacteriales bacterium]
MKSAVETLGPTRVKLTVEVPFDDLKPAVDAAYRKVAQQVRVKGFRPGKVPPRIVDQYVGRGTVLEEAVNEALPGLYGNAVREQELDTLGHPEIEVTQFTDGDELIFSAEVDVRPTLDLPDYDALPISVDDAEVSDEAVEEQLGGLRDRFATLAGVERAAASGDYVSIDLSATIDGEPVEDATADSLSYEVGSDSLVQGLDDAIVGLSVGESKEFPTQLRSGDHGGESAVATVTIRGVKEKHVPELDDDFAQTASEFDTIEELKSDVRSRLERMRLLEQGMQARDKVIEVLLDRIEVPVPEHVLGDEVAFRNQQLDQQLASAGLEKAVYAESEGKSVEELDAEVATSSQMAIKSQFVLDAIARKEELGVAEAELTDQIVRRAQQSGMRPDAYAQQIVSQGQLPALMGEVLRGKALALLMERATITDASGRPVDLDAINPTPEELDERDAEEADDAEPVEVAFPDDADAGSSESADPASSAEAGDSPPADTVAP